MSAVLTIPEHERDRLHVLAVNLPEAEMRARHAGGAGPSPVLLADLTGLVGLDPDGAELIAVGDLEGIGLAGYLVDGHDIDADAVAGQRARLDRIEGFALILRSQAFGGQGRTLRTPHLSHIASFDQPGPGWTAAEALSTDSARPRSGPGADAASAPASAPAAARRGASGQGAGGAGTGRGRGRDLEPRAMTAPVAFPPDRATYLRAHAWMAAVAMAGAMAILWAMDNPHVWTGAIAGLAAIGIRGWYLASEELAADWRIEDGVLTGPGKRRVTLGQIAQVRTLGSSTQIITTGGDKHLIKYQPDARATARAIETAKGRHAG